MDPDENSAQINKTGKLKNSLRRLKLNKKFSGLIVLVLVIVFMGSAALIFRNQNSKTEADKVLGSLIGKEQKENENIVKMVGKLTIIPEKETPEIATIADTTKLDSQPFFDRAQNGDKVIIYRTAKRVVLYRPSTNQVIETGPLSEPTATP